MRRITEFKTCEECGGPCQAIKCNANPRASEWYCEKCHRSYDYYELERSDEAQAGVEAQ